MRLVEITQSMLEEETIPCYYYYIPLHERKLKKAKRVRMAKKKKLVLCARCMSAVYETSHGRNKKKMCCRLARGNRNECCSLHSVTWEFFERARRGHFQAAEHTRHRRIHSQDARPEWNPVSLVANAPPCSEGMGKLGVCFDRCYNSKLFQKKFQEYRALCIAYNNVNVKWV